MIREELARQLRYWANAFEESTFEGEPGFALHADEIIEGRELADLVSLLRLVADREEAPRSRPPRERPSS